MLPSANLPSGPVFQLRALTGWHFFLYLLPVSWRNRIMARILWRHGVRQFTSLEGEAFCIVNGRGRISHISACLAPATP